MRALAKIIGAGLLAAGIVAGAAAVVPSQPAASHHTHVTPDDSGWDVIA